jgi:hypothetical protein
MYLAYTACAAEQEAWARSSELKSLPCCLCTVPRSRNRYVACSLAHFPGCSKQCQSRSKTILPRLVEEYIPRRNKISIEITNELISPTLRACMSVLLFRKWAGSPFKASLSFSNSCIEGPIDSFHPSSPLSTATTLAGKGIRFGFSSSRTSPSSSSSYHLTPTPLTQRYNGSSQQWQQSALHRPCSSSADLFGQDPYARPSRHSSHRHTTGKGSSDPHPGSAGNH